MTIVFGALLCLHAATSRLILVDHSVETTDAVLRSTFGDGAKVLRLQALNDDDLAVAQRQLNEGTARCEQGDRFALDMHLDKAVEAYEQGLLLFDHGAIALDDFTLLAQCALH